MFLCSQNYFDITLVGRLRVSLMCSRKGRGYRSIITQKEKGNTELAVPQGLIGSSVFLTHFPISPPSLVEIHPVAFCLILLNVKLRDPETG